MKTENYIRPVIDILVATKARRAVKYLSPKLIIRASRRTFRGRLQRRDENLQITLTIGRPNHAERAFIKQLVRAGEPFPVRKIQLKFLKRR